MEVLALCASSLKRNPDIVPPQDKRQITISVMGQTGIGKSSLVNALFDTRFKTDAVRPCTNRAQQVVVEGQDGRQLVVEDLPGIGREGRLNQAYFKDYRFRLETSDVVLWAIHGDYRPAAFDLEALHRLLVGYSREERARMMAKIVFVMTKADLLNRMPWALIKLNGEGLFMPHPETERFLSQKANYYQDLFLQPYGSALVARTPHSGDFDLRGGNLDYDSRYVYYKGLMDTVMLARLKQHFPQHEEIFQRLYEYHQVPFCSARFRYNLSEVTGAISHKLGPEIAHAFESLRPGKINSRVTLTEAVCQPNVVVFEPTAKVSNE